MFFFSFFLSLSENNRAPLQRSRSRQNVNASSVAAKAPPAKESRNESEGHPSAARAKASAWSESGRRYRNTPGHGCGLDRERVVEKEVEYEAAAPALQYSSSGAAVSSCDTNGESDVEALLAKLRALWVLFSYYWNSVHHIWCVSACTAKHALNVSRTFSWYFPLLLSFFFFLQKGNYL